MIVARSSTCTVAPLRDAFGFTLSRREWRLLAGSASGQPVARRIAVIDECRPFAAIRHRSLPGNQLHSFAERSLRAYAEARKNAMVALRLPYRRPNNR